MDKYIFWKYGILKAEGKVIQRKSRTVFRTTMGQEYPIEKTADKLTERQQKQYDIEKYEMFLKDLYFKKAKYPEETENLTKEIIKVKSILKRLKQK